MLTYTLGTTKSPRTSAMVVVSQTVVVTFQSTVLLTWLFHKRPRNFQFADELELGKLTECQLLSFVYITYIFWKTWNKA